MVKISRIAFIGFGEQQENIYFFLEWSALK